MTAANPPPQDPKGRPTLAATVTMLPIVVGWALARHVLASAIRAADTPEPDA